MKKFHIIMLASFFVAIGLIIFPRIINMPTPVLNKKEPATFIQPKVEVATSSAFTPRVTIVYDNYPYQEGLLSDWGFACLIEGIEKTILFDTGADGSMLLANLDKLGKNLAEINTVVLSHVHSDHTGGLFAFLEQNKEVEVYLLKSFPSSFKEQVRRAGASLVEVDKSREICPRVHTTGELGAGIKEQALVINTAKGLVVITGCAHPGVVEIAAQAKELLDRDLLLVMGGFHLFSTSEKGIEDIITDLQKLDAANVAPCHCSGDKARQIFKDVYQDHYLKAGVGRVITVDDLIP
jgi:7,8-dihydropterin-6-yl-methyl-4-(beta-D-ribofuranosyl)aminobenzene 5'-phosphate synthase